MGYDGIIEIPFPAVHEVLEKASWDMMECNGTKTYNYRVGIKELMYQIWTSTSWPARDMFVVLDSWHSSLRYTQDNSAQPTNQ